MKKTLALAVAAIGASSLVLACEEEKKTEPTPATSAAPVALAPTTPAPKLDDLIAKTLKSAVTAWNAHDVSAVSANYEPTAKLVIWGMPDAVGREAIATNAKDNFTQSPDFKVAITRTFVHYHTAVFEWVATGTDNGVVDGRKATGRYRGFAGANVVTFDDAGLIKEEHRYLDIPTIRSQEDPKAKAGTFRAAIDPIPRSTTEMAVSKGTPDEAKTLTEGTAIYAAIEGKKEGDLAAVLTEGSTIDDYTESSPHKGIKAITDYTKGYWTAFPDFTQAKPVQFAVGNVLVTEGIFSGTQKGPLGTLKPTNKSVTLHFVDIIDIKEGKIARVDTFGNSAEILVPLGAMSAMNPAAAGAAMAAATPPKTTK